MFCSKCGTKIVEGNSFCSECGTKVGVDNTTISNASENNLKNKILSFVNKNKNLSIAIAIVVVIASVALISGGLGNSPEKVSEKFTKNLLKGKYTEALKYTTIESTLKGKEYSEFLAEAAKREANFDIKDTMDSTFVDAKLINSLGSYAIVDITISENGKPSTEKVQLIKIDGKWKLDTSYAGF